MADGYITMTNALAEVRAENKRIREALTLAREAIGHSYPSPPPKVSRRDLLARIDTALDRSDSQKESDHGRF